VVEASPYSLIVGDGGSGEPSDRGSPVLRFSQRRHAEVLSSTKKSVHASSEFTVSATLPMQRPCEVKETSDEGLPPERLIEETLRLGGRARLC
jgi:hypothetical protein